MSDTINDCLLDLIAVRDEQIRKLKNQLDITEKTLRGYRAENARLRYTTKKSISGSCLMIENVNFDVLEEQRRSLSRILCHGADDPEDLNLLEGLLYMLDNWSDKRSKENA